jgi:catechol 2,3-dioxygenase-like lactoylglutathione lyase family enzyme
MPIKLSAAAPVLVASDVGATAEWYRSVLGFQASLFPDRPPFAFAILCRDDVEIMLRRCGPGGAQRPDGDWNVYIRMAGVRELHAELGRSGSIVEPLETKGHGCIEFAVEDPNGFRVVFSEEVPAT